MLGFIVKIVHTLRVKSLNKVNISKTQFFTIKLKGAWISQCLTFES